jgi:tetratricopeptide (TPR) repeat protein
MHPATEPTPDEDIARARAALAKGEFAHAALHVGYALCDDPTRQEWLALLDQIIAAAPGPLALAPPDAGEEYALTALRAYLQAKQGRTADALEGLLRIIPDIPDVPYLDWAVVWLDRPGGAGLPRSSLLHFFRRLLERWDEPAGPVRAGRPTLERLPEFIQVLRRTREPDADLLFLVASVLRRLGRLDAALDAAREAARVQPGYNSAVAVALAHRGRGEADLALSQYEAALRFRPGDVAVRLDMADLSWEQGRTEEAERLYREVLEREPEHPWALPSVYGLRSERGGGPAGRDQLLVYAAAHPENRRAQELARRFGEYLGRFLPEPEDATIQVLRRVTGELNRDAAAGQEGSLRITLDYLEAPSTLLAFECQLAARGARITLDVDVRRIQSPDPRLPRVPVDYLLWKYPGPGASRGTRAVPAVPRPSRDLTDLVGAIAAEPYHLSGWADRAAALAARLRPAQAADLLGVMVHPPVPPAGLPAWVWVQRLQIAAALVVARLDSGWEGSVRKKVLFDLANGPLDWTITAAIIALAALAQDDRAAERDVAALFRELRRAIPAEGYTCYAGPLLSCSRQLPGSSADERAVLP